MRLGTVPQAVASGAAVLLIGTIAAGVGIGAEPLEQAQAAQPSTDNPACGYDVYRQSLTVTSLTAKGTTRVILWKDLGYKWHGQPVREGTLVRTSKIKKGQTVTYRLKRKRSADEFTVDIVKGKLTKEDTPNGKRRVSECEAA